ncbi:TP901 family phage tail tape measure protein [Schleiferilactobacillus perolens DSM 12744]|uniref:TP901 family phage tail tape measure protein n=1 Tax=Schleiferilactobacillus perolens DSM 12744 TaxID=1423792 RepID=A0A0R1N865_9LACO|nr:TP901 family phage tail tape measure protein [Schleiferilactobacillus perolens DSM 12744]
MRAQDAALKGSERGIDSLRTHYQTMGQQMNQLQAKLKQQGATYDTLSKKSAESAEAQEQFNTRTANAASAYNRTQAQISKLQAEMGQLNKEMTLQSSGWTKASEAAGKFSSVTGKIGGALSTFGTQMTARVTAPLALGFTAAAKSAMSFNSEIDSIGPLLTNGAAVTGKYRAELDQMSAASKRWAVEYGISTTQINQGLADLVRAGYSAQQSMAMMPAILDASRASGDDFNTTMDVVTSTMTQFNVSAKDTTKVTDAMTYAANATKSGFGDMGEAMQYTGQSAHAAGVSLDMTVASIGLLSNAGLQGSMAGTAFNAMLQKLAAASSDADKPMAKLGVNVKAFKAGQIGLPEVIEQVTKSTSKMSDVQKIAAINAAFGERGGRAMLALMNQGAPALRTLTAETEKATGATKKVSEAMGNTAQANFNKFKSSLQVLSITVGQQVLPALMPVVKNATEMVQAFGKLDSATQQNIIKWAGLAMVIGPVSRTLGSVFNVVSKGSGAFMAVAGGIGRASTAAKLGATGFDVLKSGFSKTAFEALKTAPAIAATGDAATGLETTLGGAALSSKGLLAAISPIAPGLAIAGAAVIAGITVWELWGKKAYESGQRAQRWGTDIGEAADRSATKMQSHQTTVSRALDDETKSGQENAKLITQAFDQMVRDTKKSADEAYEHAQKVAKDVGGAAGKIISDQAEKDKKENTARIKVMQGYAKQVETITKEARDKNVALTNDQRQMISNINYKMAQESVKTLGLSKKQELAVLKGMTGERVNLSREEANKLLFTVNDSAQKEISAYRKKQKTISSDSSIAAKTRNDALEALEQTHNSKMAGLALTEIQARKSMGQETAQIMKDMLHDGFSEKEISAAFAQFDSAADRSKKHMAEWVADTAGRVSTTARKAGEAWNNLVLDPKTGNVVTNLPEVLANTAKTKEGWAGLYFDLKHAKISTNAKQSIAEALVATDQWNSLSPEEKTAVIKSTGHKELAEVMDNFMSWDSLSLKEQQAVIKGDYTAIVDALVETSQWNEMTLEEKQAIVKDKATVPLVTLLQKTDQWQNMSLEEKTAVVNAQGAPALADMVIKYGLFGQLDDITKQLLINDSDAKQKLIDAGIDIDFYNTAKNPEPKVLEGDSNPVRSAMNAAIDQMNGEYNPAEPDTKVFHGDESPVMNAMYNTMNMLNGTYIPAPVPGKEFDGNNDPIMGAMNQTMTLMRGPYAQTNPDKKAFPSDNSTILNQTNAAADLISGKYRTTNPNNKTFPANNSSVMSKTNAAKSNLNKYASNNPKNKNLKASDNASGPAASAKRAVSDFNSGPSVITKTLKVVADIGSKVAQILGFEGGVTDLRQNTLAMVNDQRGSTFREAIVSPRGRVMIPQGRNVMLPLPRHASVIPAAQTAKMFNIKQYASGTEGYPQTVEEINNMRFAPSSSSTTTVTTTTPTINNNYSINLTVPADVDPSNAQKIADAVIRKIKHQQGNTNLANGGGQVY